MGKSFVRTVSSTSSEAAREGFIQHAEGLEAFHRWTATAGPFGVVRPSGTLADKLSEMKGSVGEIKGSVEELKSDLNSIEKEIGN